MMFGRAFLVWLLIALLEVLQGIVRVRFLNRRVGDRRARQIGVFTGSLIILMVTWFTLPWVNAKTIPQLLAVGIFWTMLMLIMDAAFGRCVFRMSWRRIAADFNPRHGGLLGIGMVVLLGAPWLCAWLRN